VGFSTDDLEQAVAWQNEGRLDDAEAVYRRVLAEDPANVQAIHLMGGIACARSDWDRARDCFERAIALDPGNGIFHNSLGVALRRLGRLKEALDAVSRATELAPRSAAVWAHLGRIRTRANQFWAAAEAWRRAHELDPKDPNALAQLGRVLCFAGRMEEGIATMRQAVQRHPEIPVLHSNLLMALHYTRELSAEERLSEHVEWARRHEKPCRQNYPNDRSPARRLRIGYVSPDFRSHSVAFFFEPLLAAHDPAEVEIFCYPVLENPDEVSRRIQAKASHWHSIEELSDAQAVDLIRSHQIDVLVDLAGHTSQRLALFAHRPAPCQTSYLGYPSTTGLSAMAYRLTDEYTDPPGADAAYTETLIRLDSGFLCYQPPMDAPDVAAAPARLGKGITFGCFANRFKMSEQVMELWARILGDSPGSRLLLKFRAAADKPSHREVLAFFRNRGIDPSRIVVIPLAPARSAHLDLYRNVDIALDTFPYSGVTTTMEALWMGVPVLTLAGSAHVSRTTGGILHRLGLTQWVTESPEQYVARAAQFAKHPETFTSLRGQLRGMFRESGLLDGRRLARSVERAYREMWTRWLTGERNPEFCAMRR